MALTPEELATRRGTLGASDIAAVAGINPYASAHNVWMSKMGLETFTGNEATELGNELEPAILAIYAKRYAVTLRKGVYTIGPEPWISATPDAVIESGGLAEAKLVGLRSIWQWGHGNHNGYESDAAPLHYVAQAQWQLIATGEPFVDITALLGTELRNYRIRPDEKVQRNLINIGRDFWTRYVLTRTPPPADESDGARDMLLTLYPKSQGVPMRATPDLDALAEQLREAREAHAATDSRKKLIENRMREIVGDAPGAYGSNWKLRYATTKSGARPFNFEHNADASRKGRAA